MLHIYHSIRISSISINFISTSKKLLLMIADIWSDVWPPKRKTRGKHISHQVFFLIYYKYSKKKNNNNNKRINDLIKKKNDVFFFCCDVIASCDIFFFFLCFIVNFIIKNIRTMIKLLSLFAIARNVITIKSIEYILLEFAILLHKCNHFVEIL